MKRIIINLTLGLVGTGLVLTSLGLLARNSKAIARHRNASLNLYSVGERYRSRVKFAKNLLRSDSPFAQLGAVDDNY